MVSFLLERSFPSWNRRLSGFLNYRPTDKSTDHNMLVSKMLVGIALVAMLVVGVTGSGLLVQAQNVTDANQARAETALIIARSSRDQVIELRDLAESSGLDVSKANEAIEKADAVLAKAQELFDNDEFTQAWIRASQAARTYSVAFRSIANSVGPTHDFRITNAIENTQQRIERLRNILEKIEDAPPGQVQQIERHLDEAERLLAEALGIVQSDPRQAVELLKEAQKQIKEATQLLRELTSDRTNQRVGKLIEQIEKQIDRIKEVINQLDEQGKDVTEVSAKVVELEAKVVAVKALVADGEIKQAIQDLKEVRELLREILRDIRELRDIAGDNIKPRVEAQIAQIDDQIERVKRAISELEEQDKDVTEVSAKVVELEAKLAAVKALVEADEIRQAVEDLSEVRELLRDILNDIRELQGRGE